MEEIPLFVFFFSAPSVPSSNGNRSGIWTMDDTEKKELSKAMSSGEVSLVD